MVRPVFVYRRFKKEKCGSARWLLVLVFILHDLFWCQQGSNEMLSALKFYVRVARVWLFEI